MSQRKQKLQSLLTGSTHFRLVLMSLLIAIPLDSFIFIDDNKEHLEKYQCPKCQYILRDAVQTSCGHWLCQGCAEEMFEKK